MKHLSHLYLLTLLLVLVASACNKDETSNFPNIQVDEVVFLNNPSNIDLAAPGGYVNIQGGYRGILVYRRFINGGTDDFAAYDLACPEHFEQSCSVLEVSDDDTFLECPCNGEKYLIFDGGPSTGATTSLIPYNTSVSGQFVRIFN